MKLRHIKRTLNTRPISVWEWVSTYYSLRFERKMYRLR